MRVLPKSRLELVMMAEEPYLTASLTNPFASILTPSHAESLNRTKHQLLARELVGSCPGVDFVPSVVAEVTGISNEDKPDPEYADHIECMAYVPAGAGYPGFLVYAHGVGRDTLRICPLGLSRDLPLRSLPSFFDSPQMTSSINQICATFVYNVPSGHPRPFIAVAIAYSCIVFSIVSLGDDQYELQLEKSINMSSQPTTMAFSFTVPDLAIVTCDGSVSLWEGFSPDRLRILLPASRDRETERVGGWVCTFAAHPRSLLLAQRYGPADLTLLDFAEHKTTTKVMALPPATVGHIYGIARHPYNPFQFVLTTSQHVMLIDQRVVESPLLAWRHHLLVQPPSFVRVHQPHPEHPSTYIVVANRSRGEILFIQYTQEYRTVMPRLEKVTPDSGMWEMPGMRSSVFSPNRPIGLPSVFRSRKYYVPQSRSFQHDPIWSVSTTKLLPKLMFGLCSTVVGTDDLDLHMELFQMTEAGDIFAQSFELRSAGKDKRMKEETRESDHEESALWDEEESKRSALPSLMWDRTDMELILDQKIWKAWTARFNSRYGVLSDTEKFVREGNVIGLLYTFILRERKEIQQASSDHQRTMSDEEEKLRSKLRDIIFYLRHGQKTVFDIDWFLKTELGLQIGPHEIMRFMQKVFGAGREGSADGESEAHSEVSSSGAGMHSHRQRQKDARSELFERLFCARTPERNQERRAVESFDDLETLLSAKAQRAAELAQAKVEKEKRAKEKKVRREARNRRRQLRAKQKIEELQSEEQEFSFTLFPPSTPFRGPLSPPLTPSASPLPSPIMPRHGGRPPAIKLENIASQPDSQPSAHDDDEEEEDEEEEKEKDEEIEQEDYYQKGLHDLAEKWKMKETKLRERWDLPLPKEWTAAASQPSASRPRSTGQAFSSSPSFSLFSPPRSSQDSQPYSQDPLESSQEQDGSFLSQPASSSFKRPLFPSSKRSASQPFSPPAVVVHPSGDLTPRIGSRHALASPPSLSSPHPLDLSSSPIVPSPILSPSPLSPPPPSSPLSPSSPYASSSSSATRRTTPKSGVKRKRAAGF